ncbi:MAG: threonine/serine exporter family protein [Peptococcaceae bacterium]|nr:threonine/serine exporter family protein [Peptococcaceae bacterium]
MDYIMPCLCAFAACCAFALTYNIHWKRILPVCFGGALGWFVYMLLKEYGDVFAYFVATVVISIYAEIMARVCKVPVIVFLTTAILPLVPGGGMYYTMEYCIQKETLLFIETGLHTLALAGAIVLGIMTVTTLVRMGKIIHAPKHFFRSKHRREEF